MIYFVKKLTIMDWQKIASVLVLGFSIYYLIKRYRKPEDNCDDSNCGCK